MCSRCADTVFLLMNELNGDLGVRMALRDQHEDVQLAPGQTAGICAPGAGEAM